MVVSLLRTAIIGHGVQVRARSVRCPDGQRLLPSRLERTLPRDRLAGRKCAVPDEGLQPSVRERAPRRWEHEHSGRATRCLLVAARAQPRPSACMADPERQEGRPGRTDLGGNGPRDDAWRASTGSVSRGAPFRNLDLLVADAGALRRRASVVVRLDRARVSQRYGRRVQEAGRAAGSAGTTTTVLLPDWCRSASSGPASSTL